MKLTHSPRTVAETSAKRAHNGSAQRSSPPFPRWICAILTPPMNPPLNFFFSAIVCIGFIRVTVASQLVLAKIGALLLYLLSNQYSIYFSWRSFPPFSSEGVEGSVVILDLSAPPMGNPLMLLFSLVWFIFRYWNLYYTKRIYNPWRGCPHKTKKSSN